MIAARRQELADNLLALQKGLEEQEKLLTIKQSQLEIFAASLSDLLRRRSRHGEIEVLVEQVYLWRKQAGALNRSSRHLEKIDQLVAQAKNGTPAQISLSIRDCGAMLVDRQEFIDLAFRLIEQQHEA